MLYYPLYSISKTASLLFKSISRKEKVMAKPTPKFAVKNDILDKLCDKVKGYNEMYPNTNSRRAKMYEFVAGRLCHIKRFGSMNMKEDWQKLLRMIGDLEFEDVASFDEYLQTVK